MEIWDINKLLHFAVFLLNKTYKIVAFEICCLRHRCAYLPSSYQAKSQQYCGPNGPTASIFDGIWITQSGAMIFILNLDKVSLKKLFPTMNI